MSIKTNMELIENVQPLQPKTQSISLNTFAFLQHQLNLQIGAGLSEDNIPDYLQDI